MAARKRSRRAHKPKTRRSASRKGCSTKELERKLNHLKKLVEEAKRGGKKRRRRKASSRKPKLTGWEAIAHHAAAHNEESLMDKYGDPGRRRRRGRGSLGHWGFGASMDPGRRRKKSRKGGRRKLSAWNKFVAKHRKSGKSLRAIAAMYRKGSKGTSRRKSTHHRKSTHRRKSGHRKSAKRNPWLTFIRKHKGSGKSLKTLGRMYRKHKR